MPLVLQLRRRLLRKLFELFQLDQPDLDFGFYRIMHAKAQEVQDFISNDLLRIVSDAFGDVDETEKLKLQAAYEKAFQIAKDFGAPNPEETELVKKAKTALDAAKNTLSAEADVYDHLYRFFERYYDDGDFISRRYYTRETPGKAAPFAVPYNGEELKLHWANAEQYYVKSAEYFSSFTFDLWKAKEVQHKRDLLPTGGEPKALKVHFRVVEGTEGEHGNVKTSEQNQRGFIIHNETPVQFNESGELICNFEYRSDPETPGQYGRWRDKRNAAAVKTILDALENHRWTPIGTDKSSGKSIGVNPRESVVQDYLHLLRIAAPTNSDKKRPLLAKYVNQYTARNTMDYFIHKDLGNFLRRELDFYIKNELMRLDDIDNTDAPTVESYLAKIQVLRKIAGKLIDFLAQLEDFQKKLWLKKKFVVETNYCITLDRIAEKLYPEIAENEAQLEEWIKLGFVKNQDLEPRINTQEPKLKDKELDLFSQNIDVNSRFSVIEKLRANNKLVLDTRFFDDSFKARLLASIDNFDEQCEGLLIHSDNFQALNLLQERYREQVKCVYIDPPYNTGADGFVYKDSYRHSSWCSFILDRLILGKLLLMDSGLNFVSISDDEQASLKFLLDSVYSDNYIGTIEWNSTKSVTNTALISVGHTHNYIYAKNLSYFIKNRVQFRWPDSTDGFSNQDNDPRGPWKADPFQVGGERPNQLYEIENPNTGVKYRPNPGCSWKNDLQTFQRLLADNRIVFGTTGQAGPQRKRFWTEAQERGKVAKTWWHDMETTTHGTQQLKNLFGTSVFTNPKPVGLITRFLQLGLSKNDPLTLDYFAGSGTTGHAVINLNREDGGKRKYILVEMGDYFDTVLKPRIAKVVYSEKWKDGMPVPVNNRQSTMDKKKDGTSFPDPCSLFNGVSHCFKYIRLESYEDTLNNLRFDDTPTNSTLLTNPSLKEDYMLRYWLDVQMRGSQSLLNIDAFADPCRYTLKVKKPGTDEYASRAIDLIETFNYLIGLRVVHYSAPREFTAQFKRVEDPEVPKAQKTRLVLNRKLQQVNNPGSTPIDTDKEETPPCSSASICDSKSWWFRKIEGWVPSDPQRPNNSQPQKVLIVWRKLTGDIEQDNLMLDEWFQSIRIPPHDFEFDIIYVNGSNNLPNLKQENEHWKVCLIEEEFMKRMWKAQ